MLCVLHVLHYLQIGNSVQYSGHIVGNPSGNATLQCKSKQNVLISASTERPPLLKGNISGEKGVATVFVIFFIPPKGRTTYPL